MPNDPVPEITSAAALELYPAGQKIAGGSGEAWRDCNFQYFRLPRKRSSFICLP